MKYGPCLKSFRLENFKAVQKSGLVRFTPLTVLIGNNGSGKSSLIEGLETYRSIVVDGLDEAMGRWFDLQHVWNKHAHHELVAGGVANETYTNPMRFEVSGAIHEGAYRTTMLVNATPGLNSAVIQEEAVYQPNGDELFRDRNGACLTRQGDLTGKLRLKRDSSESAVAPVIRNSIKRWQFLSMLPDPMGKPMAKSIMMPSDATMLQKDGSNLVEYLLHIRAKDIAAFEGIIDSMRFVLPYAKDFQPVVTRELRPTLYLKMFETAQKGAVEIPGWLLSTGTLRILALLAVLRNPDPPPLIVIEEIENGLDPRAIGFVVDEIRSAISSGDRQVILTTHSPYLLDKLSLEHIVTVERSDGGSPVFRRPAEEVELQEWADEFAPGSLYSMGMLRSKERRVR
jgi:predicted ATPase